MCQPCFQIGTGFLLLLCIFVCPHLVLYLVLLELFSLPLSYLTEQFLSLNVFFIPFVIQGLLFGKALIVFLETMLSSQKRM